MVTIFPGSPLHSLWTQWRWRWCVEEVSECLCVCVCCWAAAEGNDLDLLTTLKASPPTQLSILCLRLHATLKCRSELQVPPITTPWGSHCLTSWAMYRLVEKKVENDIDLISELSVASALPPPSLSLSQTEKLAASKVKKTDDGVIEQSKNRLVSDNQNELRKYFLKIYVWSAGLSGCETDNWRVWKE